jgi:hypothetical protein
MFINPIALVSEKSQMPKLRQELLQPNEVPYVKGIIYG